MERIDTDKLVSLLIHCGLPISAHDKILDHLQSVARSRLGTACKRLKVKAADLMDADRACTFNLVLQGSNEATSKERRAAMLLRWCVYAREQGMNEIAKLRIVAALRDFDSDDAEHGRVMREGRKRGSTEAVRRAIRGVLEKKAKASNSDIWHTIKNNCPRGLKFHHTDKPKSNTARLPWLGIPEPATPTDDSWIEHLGSSKKTTYRTFKNGVSQEKKLLK